MSTVIEWCGFLGAWLLVIGPICQAAIELDDEDFRREDFMSAVANLPAPARLSRWWLLVPPVAYVLRARRSREYNTRLLEALDPAQTEQLMHFRETASAWMFVATGAFLLAAAETWALHDERAWPDWAFWLVLVGMLTVSISYTVMRVRRRQAIVARARRLAGAVVD